LDRKSKATEDPKYLFIACRKWVMRRKSDPLFRLSLLIVFLITACRLEGLSRTAEGGEMTVPVFPSTRAETSPVSSPTISPTASLSRIPTNTREIIPVEGRLANPGFENERIRTSLFFAGQARDGSYRYDCPATPNLGLFTVHPIDDRHLKWSEDAANRDFTLQRMEAAGLNAVSMSSWGEDSLPCTTGWPLVAPMQTAPGAQDELFSAAQDRHLVIVPFIESRNDWSLRSEFPTAADGRTAPGAVSQIVNLVRRYLLNPAHPEWAQRWAQVYDQSGSPRYALTFIHASSDRLTPYDHEAFAAGFSAIAEAVFSSTRIRVGFFLDPLPPASNAPGVFRPDPEKTGPALRGAESVLGIQSFLPEIWISGSPSEAQRTAWKRDFSRRWSETGMPFLMDVSPGYDAHIVFPGSIRYGFTLEWREQLAGMVSDFAGDGLVFNSWNGYTEGMAAMPTREYSDVFFRWLQALDAEVSNPA
jgi:hypothetical protein